MRQHEANLETSQHVHEMPFGPRLLENGGYEFRLFAPSAKSVDLCLYLNEGESIIPMTDDGNGWYKLTANNARAGQRYHFVIDGEMRVPDPASRFQPEDVHGPSELIDPSQFRWEDEDWRGRPWNEAIIYELHVGTFSPDGTYEGIQQKLDYLTELGVTAIELLPLSDFPGNFGWGYDGVLSYAPESAYGRPENLKYLINECHKRGMMVYLDVVYNHFGPDGNYLHVYAKTFFSAKHHTPWGNGINYDDKRSEVVRDFVVNNVLYWLEEFRFDGLRFDAVDTISDDSKVHILNEIAESVRTRFKGEREIHLILENGDNRAELLDGGQGEYTDRFNAQWNDDIHHAMHVLATGENSGYYEDYSDEFSQASAIEHLGRTLVEGFAYQGEKSAFRDGKLRGTPSKSTPSGGFISFIQNHDQIGNRALGERITKIADLDAVSAMVAILLLAPSPPMLFMGEEWGADTPFVWFADFKGDLATSVREGRMREFGKFADFKDPNRRKLIPDPCSLETFYKCKLNWEELRESQHEEWFEFYKRLIALRKLSIVPLLDQIDVAEKSWTITEEGLLDCRWSVANGQELKLLANPSDTGATSPVYKASEFYEENVLFQIPQNATADIALGTVPPWTVVWLLSQKDEQY
ncbi:MAG: malto-oligosyltrehalose trehalohydrolase [Candidatus Melainabacteria bacterium]|nr:malto-oligosyltrehalose trehalohydrolase [Candidatus Melainabacteria bacterium]